MRKLSFVLACIVAMSSAGCGGGGGDSAAAVGGGSTPPPSTPPTPPPATTLGSATLSWTAPQQNTDGSPLTDLAGFEIRYGQNESALDSNITISGVGTTVRVIENLTVGTWYFSIAARNSQGTLSSPSTPVSKVIS
jgi:hypothetical protein